MEKKHKKRKTNFNLFSKKVFIGFAMASVILTTPFMLVGCGEKGDQGEQGLPGKDGKNGATWYSGKAYDQSVGEVGDFFYDTDDYAIYKKNQGGWYLVSSIKSSVSINSAGYWVIDGVATKVKAKGEDGQLGKDGLTPYIKDGSWWIGDSNTQIPSTGEDGKSAYELSGFDGTIDEWLASLKGEKGDTGETGPQGEPGKDGVTPTIEISDDGFWIINNELTTNKAIGENGITPTIEISTDGYWVINREKTQVVAKGKDGSVVTIGEDDYWYIDGKKTEYKANPVYTITYDYVYQNHEVLFDYQKTIQNIDTSTWITQMPKPKSDCGGVFDGWYIKDTNKKVENYDFVGGDVTLEARWSYLPSGLYQDNVYVMNWANIKESYPDAIHPISVDFQNVSFIEEGHLVVDRSIKMIVYRGLGNCIYLNKITLPDTIERYGDEAFYNCSSLREITINGFNPSLGNNLFVNCNNLKTVEFTKNITYINIEALSNCSSIEEIIVDETNPIYSSCNGCLYNKNLTTLIKCPEGFVFNEEASSCLSVNITNIGDYSFANCVNLEGIDWSGISVGKYAFKNTNLKSFYGGVLSYEIDDRAFEGCESLETVNLGNVTSIGDYVFEDCYNLSSITVGEYNKHFVVDGGALYDIEKTTLNLLILSNYEENVLELPETLKSIKPGAFIDYDYENYHVNEVHIPETLITGRGYNDWIYAKAVVVDSSGFLPYCMDIFEEVIDGYSNYWGCIADVFYINEKIKTQEFEDMITIDYEYEKVESDKSGYNKYVCYYEEDNSEEDKQYLHIEWYDLYQNEDLDNFNIKVTFLNDGEYVEINDYTISEIDTSVVGTQEVIITYDIYKTLIEVEVYEIKPYVYYLYDLIDANRSNLTEDECVKLDEFQTYLNIGSEEELHCSVLSCSNNIITICVINNREIEPYSKQISISIKTLKILTIHDYVES